MSTTTIGHSAKQAVEFLRQFFNDVYALVKSLDSELTAKGWHAPRSRAIADELSNSLEAKHWVLETLTRFYVPGRPSDEADRILAVTIEFAPRELDQAFVLCVSARWPRPVDVGSEIWEQWISSDGVLGFLGSHPGVHELSRDQLNDGFMPGAMSARAFALPLSSLTDAATLRELLIAPALTLVAH